MANIKQDKYELGQSEGKTINNLGEEIRLDLNLVINSLNNDDGQIFGTVSDATGNGIKDAYVTLMNKEYKPLMSISTDEFGQYSFGHLVAEIDYKVFARADGKELSQGPPIFLNPFEQREINFNLQNNEDKELSIIAADVIDSDSGNPIENLTVSIYSLNETNERNLQAILYTNEYGQFVFREGLLGEYVINIKSDNATNFNKNVSVANFQEKEITINITETGSVVPINIPIEPVVIPVSLSPNFLEFKLQYAKKYLIGRYIASTGVMGNQAHVNDSTGFVRSLGTYRRGFVSIDINVPRTGFYLLNIQYISLSDRILSIFVNGKYPLNFYCYTTVGGTLNDARIRHIYLYLEKGVSNLKFTNYFELAAPEINEIKIDILPFANTIQIANGVLENQAQAIIGGYVANIGGPNNGKVTFTVYAPISGDYLIDIKYLSSTTEYRGMKIHVDNGFRLDGNFPPTPSSYITDGVKALINIGYLTKGNHSIQFYNDSGNYSIIPGLTELMFIAPITTLTKQNGVLANGAKVSTDTGFVSLLGGTNKGSITFYVNLSKTTSYSISVEYINSHENIGDMQISVNNGQYVYTYVFPKTPGNTAIDSKFYYFTTPLSQGSNTIKFYNDQNASVQSPAIKTIYIQELLINNSYSVGSSNITLFGEARVDRGSLVGIGYNKGYATIKFDSLPFLGVYDFLMTYGTFDYTRESSLDVNNISLGEPFSVIKDSPNFINTLNIPVNFNTGINTIKIYNTEYLPPPKDTNSYSPYFTSFELFYTQNYRIHELKASTVTLGNGVTVNPDTGFVRGIGGDTGGFVYMEVNIPSSGAYSIGVQYLSFEEQMLSLSINGIHSTNVYCSSTGSENVESSSKIYYFSVYLNSGINSFRFYNYFNLSSPEINNISINILPYATTTEIANGTLEGGAIKLDNGYIGNIGTDKYGSVTFKINCPMTGHYVFGLMYLNAQYDRQMWISIDSIKGTLYEFKATPNNLASDGVEAIIDVGYLTKGEHTVKYYSEIPLQSILPGRTQLRLIPNTIKSFAKGGLLENGAEVLPSGYVHKIGGNNKGAVKLTISTPFANKYSIGIEYVNGDGIIGDMQVSVNGSYPVKYIFPKTSSNHGEDAKIYYFNVELKTGNNIIKLYNDENVSVQSPVINTLIFQEILIDEIYKVPNNNITYSGDARALDGKVINIGGGSGDITLNYSNLPFYGIYYLIMRYVTLNDNNTSNISVNGISPRNLYYFNKTNSLKDEDSKFITVPVSFKLGNNTIKIYNN